MERKQKVADVAEDDFAPFYDAFMPGLKAMLQSAQGKDYRMLRGKAMAVEPNVIALALAW